MMKKTVLLAQLAVIVAALPQQLPLPSTLKGAKHHGKPLINSKALQASISTENLLARSEALYKIAQTSEDEYNHPTRVIGSAGHWATLAYIYSTIARLGDYYTLNKQSFPAVLSEVLELRLVLDDVVPEDVMPLSGTPPTPNNEPVFAPLILITNDGCDAGDYPANVSQAIAFIRRGTCSFSDKSVLAGRAGAQAAVIYNNQDESFAGTLGDPSPDHVASFGISGNEAKPFVDKLKAGGNVDASAYMDAYIRSFNTTNIIAQTIDGDQDNCVMLGGHSDSVAAGPGINDDGSGTVSLLEVATQLTAFKVNNCVRFAWWAGEEEGLWGSNWYVQELSNQENMKIRLFMDYDMMASPNFAYQVYNATNAVNPVGSEELRNLYVQWYKDEGLNYTFIDFDGRSDYDAFIRNGIPGGGIATGAERNKTEEEALMFGGRSGIPFDPCYHALCDDVSNLNMTAFEVNTKLIAHSVATYALSFDDFPARVVPTIQETRTFQKPSLYRGSKLNM